MRRLLVAGVVVLGGCASLSPDAGFSDVEKAVQERAAVETKWVRSEDEADTVHRRVKELLAKPLGPQEAVQVALLNNPGLQAGYAEVGIAERADDGLPAPVGSGRRRIGGEQRDITARGAAALR